MAEPDDEREEKQKPEDLFTDLDKFFAPIEEDWPEEAGESAEEAPGEGDAALEEWTGPKIRIPDEEELLGDETATPTEEPAPAAATRGSSMAPA